MLVSISCSVVSLVEIAVVSSWVDVSLVCSELFMVVCSNSLELALVLVSIVVSDEYSSVLFGWIVEVVIGVVSVSFELDIVLIPSVVLAGVSELFVIIKGVVVLILKTSIVVLGARI